MARTHLKTLTATILLLLTLLVATYSLANTSISVVTTYSVELGVYSLLTALALTLTVPLSRGELSIAHAMGMIAFLSLDAEAAPAMTVAIFFGGILGSFAALHLVEQNRLSERRTFSTTNLIFLTAQVTLPFFVTSRVYADIFQAPQPLGAFLTDSGLNLATAPLFLYAFLYIALYFVIFVLEQETVYQETRHLINENQLSLFIIITLPVPFAIIAASVARRDTSIAFFTTVIVGTALIIFGLYVLNRTQHLLRRQLNEVRSISIATQAMRGSLDIDSLLRTTYVQVSQLLNTQHFMIALRDSSQSHLTFPLVIRDGEEQNWKPTAQPDDLSLIDHVLTTKEPLLLPQRRADYTDMQPLPQRPRDITSWLGIPLINKDNQAIGAFIVRTQDEQRFDENDLRLLNIIATSASIAIENASLYQQKSARTEQLATLNQVTTLLTGTLAPNEVLDTIVSSASTIAEANAIAVYLVSHDNNKPELKLVRSAGLSDDFEIDPPSPIIIHNTSDDSDLLKPKSLVIGNIHAEARQVGLSQMRQRMRDEAFNGLIEILLMIHGRRLGVLCLYFKDAQEFQEELVDLIQAFGTQAAQAIDNAYTFTSTDKALERRVEQLYALAAMGRLLNATMDTQRIYQIVLTYVTDATSTASGMIILQSEGKKLSIPSAKGYGDDTLSDPSLLTQGLTGRVLQTGQPLRVGDTRLETGYLPLLPSTRSMLIVPIMKRRNVLGLILLEHSQPAHYSESDTHFVAQIANQAVIAVDNTQLFQRVREARDNLQTILNAMEDGIILIDSQGQVVLANPRVDLIGLDVETILEQPIQNLIDDDTLAFPQRLGFRQGEGLLRLLKDISAEDKAWPNLAATHYEISTTHYGTQYIQRQIIPVRTDEHHIIGILLVFYNKTEEQELARQRESFSQMIVHDLRSPLTAVTTSLRLLQELVPDESDFRPIVEKTTDASRRAIRKVLNRVDSLLDISKMESGEMSLDREPIDLITLADSVANELRPLADELEVEIINQVSPDLPPLDVDGDKIERVLLNLVDNALKYSPANSRVVINSRIVDKQFLQVEVIDNGPGVPADYKKRLFDRFVQVEGRQVVRRGVGLGLAFCKLVTEAHGGKIWVEDNPDGGSIFIATLPIAILPELAD